MSAPQRKASAGRGAKYEVPAPDLERLRLLQQKLQEQQHLLLLRQQDAGVESETAVAAAQAAQEAAAAIAAAAAGKEDYSWVGKPGVARGRITKTVSGSEFRPHRKRMVVAPPITSTTSAPLLAAMRGVAAVPAAAATAGVRPSTLPTAAAVAGGSRLVGQSASVSTSAVSAVRARADHAKLPSAAIPAGSVSPGAAGAVAPVPATAAAAALTRGGGGGARGKTAEDGEEPEESTASLEAAVATASYYDGVAGEFPPAQSAWFKIGAVHEIERLALPEFFDGRHAGLTPHTYRAMRDSMVRMSLENPAKHLSFTHCRRLVGGEISTVYRVYQFLDHWGLINGLPTQAFESTSGAQALGVPFPGTFDDVAGAVGTALADAFLRAAAPEDTAIKVEEEAAPPKEDDGSSSSSNEEKDGTKEDSTAMVDSSSSGNETAHTDVPIKQDPDAPQDDAMADSAGDGAPALHTAVDNTLVTHYSIFGDAHVAGGPGSTGSGGHGGGGGSGKDGERSQGAAARRLLGEWVRMDDGDAGGDDDDGSGAGGNLAGDIAAWTEQETALLLQGVLEHPDDWDSIEELVGSKTRQQCVMQFLRLPLADVGRDEDSGGGAGDTGDSASQPLPETLLAFLADCFEDPGQALAAVDAAKSVLVEKSAGGGSTAAETDLEAIVLAALAAASIKADALAAVEEHEMRLLVLEAAALQLQKLDIKLRQLVLYEGCIEDEWVLLERARVRVLSQRLLFVRNQLLHHPPAIAK